jgi:hypothetical protein
MPSGELSWKTPDSRCYVPYTELLGTTWRHTGTGNTYLIFGFTWNAEDDIWMILYHRLGGYIPFSRTPANFFGLREDGSTRFVPVGGTNAAR